MTFIRRVVCLSVQINSLKEIQDIELDILTFVADFCENHGLRYYLIGGSLLGAVRHHGFIPWDDDVDICMPRPDYDALCDLFDEQANDHYRLLKVENDNNYFVPYIKIIDSRTYLIETDTPYRMDEMGVFIDIFPLDGTCPDLQQANKLRAFVDNWSRRISKATPEFEGLRFPAKIKKALMVAVFRPFGRANLLNLLSDLMRRYPYDQSSYVVSTFGIRNEKEIMARDIFSDSVFLVFENTQFRAPIGYDAYLERMYENYMELPPLKERSQPHTIKAWWK